MSDFTNFAELIAKYNSTLPTLSDGQASELQVDSNGRLLVQANISVELSAADGDNLYIMDSTGTNALAIDVNGAIKVTDGGLSLTVDNGGTFAVQVDGAALTALQLIDNAVYAVDTAAGATDGGYNILAVRDDALTTLTPVDGDYVSLRTNDKGALWVKHDGSLSVTISGGTEADKSSDAAADGLISLTAGPDVLVSIPHVAGTYKISGWSWSSDKQCTFRLEIYDAAVLVEIIRVMLNSGSTPSGYMHFETPIEIAGATDRVIRVSAAKIGGGAGGSASAGINGFTV